MRVTDLVIRGVIGLRLGEGAAGGGFGCGDGG